MESNEAMKAKILFISLIIGLSMITACSNENPMTQADCLHCSFKENYAKNINREDVFFVKGKVADNVLYGKRIEILEDFKGSFKDKSPVTVWGSGGASNRIDDMRIYNLSDTLIMLLTHSDQEEDMLRTNNTELWNEKETDYITYGCCASVLKLSNGQVTGFINPVDTLTYEGIYSTMSWNELQDYLNNASINK